MEAGRQNVRQHGQVHDLGQGLVLVRKLEQVEIGVGDHDVAGLPADLAAHVPDEVSASTEHLSARTSSKRLTSDPDVRRQDLQRPVYVETGQAKSWSDAIGTMDQSQAAAPSLRAKSQA